MMQLQDQTAVITGASSGIGRAIALTFAAQGAQLVLHARANQAGLEETAQLAREYGVECHCLLADLSCAEQRDQFSQSVFDLGVVNIWVNNAGADILTGTNTELSFSQKLETLWNMDVLGTIELCRLISAPMSETGKRVNATILNMGWDQAEVGQSGDSGQLFGPTKAAVMAYSKSLARSLAPHVRVNCLAPGWIQTAWGEVAPEDWAQRAQSEALMQRWGTPEDVANAALYAVAPTSSFITGQIISVNGGLNHEQINSSSS
jgi:3-oxoacyl-[acyl-carrier protein] reductase|tara:strand:+ start:6532 stop:7317 length:786 start_codon:yes stop_codon:yes gene_type:complete